VAAAAIASPLAVASSAQAADGPVVPANPLSAPVCNTLPVLPTAPAGVTWSTITDHRALNGKVGVSATPTAGGTFSNGATSKAYAAQACLFGAPTVAVDGTGVPQYGASANGTWKVGSKVNLPSGAEATTHGGTNATGPVTRYRLVFTPNAGFTLPADLPGDGFKVGTSAVFHVYVITTSYNDAFFGPVTCVEAQGSNVEGVSCTFGSPRTDLAGTSGVVGWNSDFDGTGGGTLTYTVNAEGTGYTGKVTY
jgi:hypothetical protein